MKISYSGKKKITGVSNGILVNDEYNQVVRTRAFFTVSFSSHFWGDNLTRKRDLRDEFYKCTFTSGIGLTENSMYCKQYAVLILFFYFLIINYKLCTKHNVRFLKIIFFYYCNTVNIVKKL